MMQNRNIPIANCIFTPTVTTALAFIAVLSFRREIEQVAHIYLWAGIGCLVAAVFGFVVGWSFRNSERYNYLLRWLLGSLMVLLIGLAFVMTLRDVALLLE
jgi:hypothetical protein